MIVNPGGAAIKYKLGFVGVQSGGGTYIPYTSSFTVYPETRVWAHATASNLPDSLSNGKHFAIVHGYNVTQDAAQGWHAEIFKRMHQMGSKAKFIGVTWDGDTAPDYHNAVYRAFKTSAQVAGELGGYSDLTIAAHSLGNMVVSNAISKHNFLPSNYYLLNAATPIEAYDSTQLENSSGNADMNEFMTESDWKDYPDRLFAANWYDLFESGDARRQLTWKDRFASVQTVGHNFFSPGEDVVENAGDNESVTLALINIFKNWVTGNSVGTHAWVTQEISKGGKNVLTSPVFSQRHGGWDFNYTQNDLVYVGIAETDPDYPFPYRVRLADQTGNNIPTKEQLAQLGFFKTF